MNSSPHSSQRKTRRMSAQRAGQDGEQSIGQCGSPRLPTVTYSLPHSLRGERIARCEGPRSRDVQDVGIALNIGWESGIRPAELNDALRGDIEHFVAGGPIDGDALHAAVGTYAHRQQ